MEHSHRDTSDHHPSHGRVIHVSFKTLVRLVAGLILVMVGIIGLIFPLIQAWIVVMLGFFLLSPAHGRRAFEWFKRKVNRLYERWKN